MPAAAGADHRGRRGSALTETLRQAGIEEPEADARLLIGHALGLDRAALMSQWRPHARAPDEIAAIDALAARRLKHEPVSRIFGIKEFWSLPLQVSDAVLVPRPETETVVEAALDFVVRGGLRIEPLAHSRHRHRIGRAAAGAAAANCRTPPASPPISARPRSTSRAPMPNSSALRRAAASSSAISPTA